MRQSKQRRRIQRLFVPLVAIITLGVVLTSFSGAYTSLFKSFSSVKIVKQQYAEKEVPKTIEKVETPKFVLQKSILAATPSGGQCGQAWKWPCDRSLLQGTYVNGKLKDQAGNTIYFENTLFKKQPPGLEIPSGASTKVKITDDNGTKEKDDDVVIYEGGLCLVGGEEYESLAMISMSQPLLPKTIQGLEISMLPVDAEKDEYAKINLDWLSRLEPDQFEQLFCSLAGDYSEYTLRTIDQFRVYVSSNNLGLDWPDFVQMKCNGRRPGQPKSEFVADWKPDVDRDTTIFRVLIENNEAHNEVNEHHRPKMLKTGLSGIINPGAGYIGGLAFQPMSDDTYIAKLAGSAISSSGISNYMAAPQKTTTDLMKNGALDLKTPGTESSTLLSTKGAYQDEFEYATVESIIFGGVYYIPESEIDQGGNPSMLSYDPKKLDPDMYMCDEQSRNSRCPIVRAVSGCSGVANAKVSIRLRQIVLSAVNDTDSYAATTGGGGAENASAAPTKTLSTSLTKGSGPIALSSLSNSVLAANNVTPSSDEVARSYTRAGDFFQGQFRMPQGSIKKATVDELIVLSGKGTPSCTTYATERIQAQGSTKLSELDEEVIQRMSQEPNYNMQQILVSPVNVRYKSWANYKRDPYVLGLVKVFLPGLYRSYMPDPEWASDVVEGEAIRPALISFKADSLYRGSGGRLPGSDESVDVQKNIDAYLAKQKILPLTDAKIDCMTGPYGTPEYWLCSDSKTAGLPKCQ